MSEQPARDTTGVNRCTAIVKKLQQLLEKQHNHFRLYLDILNHETRSIQTDEVEQLRAQIDLETALIRDIRSFQKVISPLDRLYRQYCSRKEPRITYLEESIARLGERINRQSGLNRQSLKTRMQLIKEEIRNTRIPKNTSSFDSINTAKMIDITT